MTPTKSYKGKGDRHSRVSQSDISQFIEEIHRFLDNLETRPPSRFEAIRIIRWLGLGEGSAFIFTRDTAIYNTVSIVNSAGYIVGGGYGINAAYFSGYERRLSLADLDILVEDASEDEVISTLNGIAESMGLAINELGITIGTFHLEPRKTAWLRQRVITRRMLALQRTVLLPEEYGHGVPLERYVTRILREEPWAYKVVRMLRSEGLGRLKVDRVEIDVDILREGEIEYQKRTIDPILAMFHKSYKSIEAKIVNPSISCRYFIMGLRESMERRQTHNFLKMLLDLRLAKVIGYEEILEEVRVVLRGITDWIPALEDEWIHGTESWRFALLRRKYKSLKQLLKTWFE